MEAALRTAYHALTGKEADMLAFTAVRGMEGVKEAEFNLNGKTLKVAVASGMKNAKPILDDIRNGKSKYAFIEIMCCPGGCVNGGGQPIVRSVFMPNEDLDIEDTYVQKRAAALYSEDEKNTLRQSHNNPQIQELYKDYLGEIGGEKAHGLLHTHYHARERYKK